MIGEFGAISSETAQAMAKACRKINHSDIGVSITGVAGPDPSEGHKPGTVFIGISFSQTTKTFKRNIPGNRSLIKQRAAIAALFELQRFLQFI